MNPPPPHHGDGDLFYIFKEEEEDGENGPALDAALDDTDSSDDDSRPRHAFALGLGALLLCGAVGLRFHCRPAPVVAASPDDANADISIPTVDRGVTGSGPCSSMGAKSAGTTAGRFLLKTQVLPASANLLERETLDGDGGRTLHLPRAVVDCGTTGHGPCNPVGATSTGTKAGAFRLNTQVLPASANLLEREALDGDGGRTLHLPRAVAHPEDEDRIHFAVVGCGTTGHGPCNPVGATSTGTTAGAFRLKTQVLPASANLLEREALDSDGGRTLKLPRAVVHPEDGDRIHFAVVDCGTTGHGPCNPVGATSMGTTAGAFRLNTQVLPASANLLEREALDGDGERTVHLTRAVAHPEDGHSPYYSMGATQPEEDEALDADGDRATMYPYVDCGATGRGGGCYPPGATATARPDAASAAPGRLVNSYLFLVVAVIIAGIILQKE